MANGGCDCICIVAGIISGWILYHSCKENLHVQETQLCFYLCLIKTIGGTVVKLLEACHMNENPHDRNCRRLGDFFTRILNDLPLFALSILLIDKPTMCHQGQASHEFSDIMMAFHINGWMSLLQSVYHLMKSCRKNWRSATFHIVLAGFVILRSNCTNLYI